ncbi:uncharacterized protein METZ01_LOCUS477900, partial [marine metagenome]
SQCTHVPWDPGETDRFAAGFPDLPDRHLQGGRPTPSIHTGDSAGLAREGDTRAVQVVRARAVYGDVLVL